MTIKTIIDKTDRIAEYQPGFDLLLDLKFAVKYRKAYKSKLYGDLCGIFSNESPSFVDLWWIRKDYLKCRKYLLQGDFCSLSDRLECINKEGLSEIKNSLKTLEKLNEVFDRKAYLEEIKTQWNELVNDENSIIYHKDFVRILKRHPRYYERCPIDTIIDFVGKLVESESELVLLENAKHSVRVRTEKKQTFKETLETYLSMDLYYKKDDFKIRAIDLEEYFKKLELV